MTKEGLRSGQSRTRIDRVGPASGMTEQNLPGRTVTAGVYNKKIPKSQDFRILL